MEKYTKEEINLINFRHKPINKIDINLTSSIVHKMLLNHKYEELIQFLNRLYDFAKIPINIVNILIQSNNKECISVFLENEDDLYFFDSEEKDELKDFLNVREINIKLENTYDYYYKMLYKQGIRNWRSNTVKNNVIEHTFTRYNKLIKLKLKDIKDIGVVVSCIIYSNYYLPEEEQILKGIDYINEFGFNINKDINNKAIIKNML